MILVAQLYTLLHDAAVQRVLLLRRVAVHGVLRDGFHVKASAHSMDVSGRDLWLVFWGNGFHFNWLSAVLAFDWCVLVLEDPEITFHTAPDAHMDCSFALLKAHGIIGLITVDSFEFDRMAQFEHNGADPNHYKMRPWREMPVSP